MKIFQKIIFEKTFLKKIFFLTKNFKTTIYLGNMEETAKKYVSFDYEVFGKVQGIKNTYIIII